MITATINQKTDATPIITVLTSQQAPGLNTVSLKVTSLSNLIPVSAHWFNILAPETLIEVDQMTVASGVVSVTSTFKSGRYGFKLLFDGYGYSQQTNYFDVSKI